MSQKFNTVELIRTALLTALICVSAYIVIPLPLTPINLTAQTLIINLTALFLTPRQAAFTMVVYTPLGLTGLPVFSGGMGGPGELLGPTGGYIVPWIPVVMLISWLRGGYYSFKRCCLVTILAGMPVIYLIEGAYVKFITGMDWAATLTATVAPFIPLDILKCFATALIAKPVQVSLSNAQWARQEAFMGKVLILGGLRSHIGVRNGAYCHVPTGHLSTTVLKELTARYQPSKIDMTICNNCVGGGGNVTHLMVLETGLSEPIPSVTVGLQCASSPEATITAAVRIQNGLADLVIAGGFKSSSTQPLRSYNPNHPYVSSHTDSLSGNSAYIYNGSPTDNSDAHRTRFSLMYSTAKFIPGPCREDVILQGAEKIICHYHIGPGEMDAWMLESHKRAYKAAREDLPNSIAVPVYGPDHDGGIRPRLNQRLLNRLPCVLRDGRYLNAASTCIMNDGVAFPLLRSEPYLKEHKLSARLHLTNVRMAGADLLMSPASVLPTAKDLLGRSRLSMNSIGAIECSEVFAVIDVLINRVYPDQASRYNQLGGALVYGHPYGASGAIILLHLMKSVELSKSSHDTCCVAAVGGIGSVILLE